MCEQAEALMEEKSINKIHSELQLLHEKWKEVGPVKRELREEIWERFKEATHKLHKRRNEHFLDLKETEEPINNSFAVSRIARMVSLWTSFDFSL